MSVRRAEVVSALLRWVSDPQQGRSNVRPTKLASKQTGNRIVHPLTWQKRFTTSVFEQPFFQHTLPLSFFAFSSAFFLSSPPGRPAHVSLCICRSTASFGSREGRVGTTSWQSGH